ncbi:DUF2630 family protein [Saccharothrix sp. AJ9571]|nr:DUF2630 family protein [Saccharothrix sp. AJ9571]
MADDDITERITQLIDEEHRIQRDHIGREATTEERDRLRAIEVQLDRYWDLLRQRQARRESGQNPEDADLRSANTVENYRQ